MVSSKERRGIRKNIKPYNLKRNYSGIVQNKEELFVRPDEALDIVNMHSTKTGAWSSRRAGYTRLNTVAYESGASIDGLTVYTDSSNNKHLFAAINGKLKEITISTGAIADIDASAGYTAGDPVDFAQIGNILYSVDGNIAIPRKWNGATASNSGGFPIGGTYGTPKYIVKHLNRMVYLNFSGNSSHFAISDLGAPETFTLAGSSATDGYVGEAGAGDGQEITGAYSINVPLTNQSILVIFKERSTYVLVGYSGNTSDADHFQLFKVSSEFGCINNKTIVEVGADLLFMDQYGINSYQASQQSGTVRPIGINSNRLKESFDSLNIDQSKTTSWGIHLRDRREVIFAMPTNSSTQNNEYIVYRYPDPGDEQSVPRWSRRRDSGGYLKIASCCLYNKQMYIGDYAGFVSSMFTSDTYNGVSIPWEYDHAPFDFGNEKQIKRIVNAEVHFKTYSTHNLAISTEWQGGNNNNQRTVTVPVDIGSNGAIYNTGVYGSSFFGETKSDFESFKVAGNGCRFKRSISGNGPIDYLGENFIVEFGTLSQHAN